MATVNDMDLHDLAKLIKDHELKTIEAEGITYLQHHGSYILTQFTYTDEGESNTVTFPDKATLEVRVKDGGNGCYIVVNVHEWAMDNEAEVDAFATKIKGMLPIAWKLLSPYSKPMTCSELSYYPVTG